MYMLIFIVFLIKFQIPVFQHLRGVRMLEIAT